MNQLGSLTSPAKQKPTTQINPFAKSLLEQESNLSSMPSPSGSGLSNPLAEALARSGGSFGDFGAMPSSMPDFLNNPAFNQFSGDKNNQFGDPNNMPDWMQDPQAQAKAQEKARLEQEKKLLRKKLHDKVNPVDSTDIYSAREQQVKKQIEELRKELRAMATEIKVFNKEVDLTLLTETAEPGTTGTYFINFFHQLRQLINLLRQKIRSARTWLNTAQSKKKKKPKRGGILIEGQKHEQTTSIFDTMHHERSSTYGGS